MYGTHVQHESVNHDVAVLPLVVHRNAGHDVEVLDQFEEVMGHAGALIVNPDGLIEGASDPRSDGAAAAV